MTSKSPRILRVHPALARLACAAFLLAATASSAVAQTTAPPPTPIEGHKETPLLPGTPWHVHDPDRPRPAVVTPGTFPTADTPGRAPSDATILFDGHDLSAWSDDDGHPPTWKLNDGTITPSGGAIRTVQEFGDVQVHVEFAEPAPAHGHGQERGNSGVFLQGLYEVQVLDSYDNPTYPDGQASAIYGQTPPQVNAARPPGEWQAYDIIFTVARFDRAGRLQTPAYLTVLHNGVLVQNHVALLGPTVHAALAKYEFISPVGPLSLQDHGNAVRYRNVWLRPLVTSRANP